MDLHRLSARYQAPQRVGALGDGVLGYVEDRAVVSRPRGTRDALGERAPDNAGRQVLHEQLVLAEARRVRGVDELGLVVAHLEVADREEREALRQLVLVEQDLLGRFLAVGSINARGLAATDRILETLDRPAVVVETPDANGHAQVGLLDAPEHLRVERLAERLDVAARRLQVGVLRLEVLLHLGRALLAQPVVGIDEAPAVKDLDVVLARGLGRRGQGARAHQQDTSGAGDDRGQQGSLHRDGPPHGPTA